MRAAPRNPRCFNFFRLKKHKKQQHRHYEGGFHDGAGGSVPPLNLFKPTAIGEGKAQGCVEGYVMCVEHFGLIESFTVYFTPFVRKRGAFVGTFLGIL